MHYASLLNPVVLKPNNEALTKSHLRIYFLLLEKKHQGCLAYDYIKC